MRIDKWVWAIRMVKTRTRATEMCKSGKVLLNGNRTKPSADIRIGDSVQVEYPGLIKIYEVTGLIEKRVGAKDAKEFYIDHSPEPERTFSASAPIREKGTGRPTKRERRALEKITGDG